MRFRGRRHLALCRPRDRSRRIEFYRLRQVSGHHHFFFNGSTDELQAQQLKNLYLKQEFSQFAFENQGKSAGELQEAFREFVQRTQPNLTGPTWAAGLSLG